MPNSQFLEHIMGELLGDHSIITSLGPLQKEWEELQSEKAKISQKEKLLNEKIKEFIVSTNSPGVKTKLTVKDHCFKLIKENPEKSVAQLLQICINEGINASSFRVYYRDYYLQNTPEWIKTLQE